MVSIRRFAAAALVAVSVQALAQTPRPTSGAAPAEASKPDGVDNVRIRGLVERVDEAGAVVQLSQGLSIRVDLPGDAHVMAATRAPLEELKPGVRLRLRTRAAAPSAASAPGAPAFVAADVVVLGANVADESIDAGEMSARGVLKALERTPEGVSIVVSDKGTDRRVQATGETAVWRLQRAALKDIRPGALLSVLIVRGADGRARAERAVFGPVPAGGDLPL